MKKLFLLSLLPLMALPAWAVPHCAEHDFLVQTLNRHFDEQLRIYANNIEGDAIIEIFVSKKDTWTLVMTGKSRISCIVSSGHNWTEIKLGRAANGP